MSDHNNNITCPNTCNAKDVECRSTSITTQREMDEAAASRADQDVHEIISGSRLRKPENEISSHSAPTSSSSSPGASERIKTRTDVAMSNHERVRTVPHNSTSTTSILDDHVTPSTGHRAGDDESRQECRVVDRIVESVSNDLSKLDDGVSAACSEETNVAGETTDNTSSLRSSELGGEPAVASHHPTTTPQPEVGQLDGFSVTGVNDDDVNAGRQAQKGSRGSTEGRNIFNEFIFSVLRKLLMADDSTMKTPTNQDTVSNLIDWRPTEETSSGEEEDDDYEEEEDYKDSDDDESVDAFPDGGRIGSRRGHDERVADEVDNRLTCTCDDRRHNFSVTSSSAELHSSVPDVELSTGVGHQPVPAASRGQQSIDGQSIPLRRSDGSAVTNEQSSLPKDAVPGVARPPVTSATRPSDCRSINVEQMGLEDALRFVINKSSQKFQSAVVTTSDETASCRETDV